MAQASKQKILILFCHCCNDKKACARAPLESIVGLSTKVLILFSIALGWQVTWEGIFLGVSSTFKYGEWMDGSDMESFLFSYADWDAQGERADKVAFYVGFLFGPHDILL